MLNSPPKSSLKYMLIVLLAAMICSSCQSIDDVNESQSISDDHETLSDVSEDEVVSSSDPPIFQNPGNISSSTERSESSISNDCAEVRMNPSTSMPRDGDNVDEWSNRGLRADEDEIKKSIDVVFSLMDYLQFNLSPEAYGGFDTRIRENGMLDLFIWAVDNDAIDTAVRGFEQEHSDVEKYIIRQDAKCSMADMNHVVATLDMIQLDEGEILRCFIDELSNTLIVNVSFKGEDRLRNEIEKVVKTQDFPEICIAIYAIEPRTDNPLT